MRSLSKRRWRIALCFVVLVAGMALWWLRPRPGSEPLADGLEAYAAGDWARAAATARQRLRRASDDQAAIRLLARSSIRQSRDSVASALYDRLDPRSLGAEDLYLMGSVIQRSGDKKGSITLWERALSVDPDHAETLFASSRSFLDSQVYRGAAMMAQRLAGIPRLASSGPWSAGQHPPCSERCSRGSSILAACS